MRQKRRSSLADEAVAALAKSLPADAKRIKSLTCQLALAVVLNLTFIAVFLFFLRETYISKTTTKFLSLDRARFFCSMIEICLNSVIVRNKLKLRLLRTITLLGKVTCRFLTSRLCD